MRHGRFKTKDMAVEFVVVKILISLTIQNIKHCGANTPRDLKRFMCEFECCYQMNICQEIPCDNYFSPFGYIFHILK